MLAPPSTLPREQDLLTPHLALKIPIFHFRHIQDSYYIYCISPIQTFYIAHLFRILRASHIISPYHLPPL